MSKYNGWTNYATWRVNLEFFDGNYESYEGLSGAALREVFEEYLAEESGSTNSLVFSYAMAFIGDVDWYEIEEHIREYNERGDE